MTDKTGPPAPPPTVRPVGHEVEDGPRRPEGRITQVSEQPIPQPRTQLAPWQRDTLVAMAVGDSSFRAQPKLLRTLADLGLVEVSELADPGAFIARITDAGREALRRGWYPAP